jgi:hypothetical protein
MKKRMRNAVYKTLYTCTVAIFLLFSLDVDLRSQIIRLVAQEILLF